MKFHNKLKGIISLILVLLPLISFAQSEARIIAKINDLIEWEHMGKRVEGSPRIEIDQNKNIRFWNKTYRSSDKPTVFSIRNVTFTKSEFIDRPSIMVTCNSDKCIHNRIEANNYRLTKGDATWIQVNNIDQVLLELKKLQNLILSGGVSTRPSTSLQTNLNSFYSYLKSDPDNKCLQKVRILGETVVFEYFNTNGCKGGTRVHSLNGSWNFTYKEIEDPFGMTHGVWLVVKLNDYTIDLSNGTIRNAILASDRQIAMKLSQYINRMVDNLKM